MSSTLGEYTVGEPNSGHLQLAVSAAPFEYLELEHKDGIKALDFQGDVLVVPASHQSSATILAEYSVYDSGGILQTKLFTPALEPLNVSPGDKVEAVERPVGFLLTTKGDEP
ncbi:hypothetical protein [Halobellus clavatus]|uniref:hypothetical protein n=1 Tax=Halobellus clavatus TaxID=660517 RepID=UPI0011138102|nr:hypothetical protein [Halobellus clavatus]